MGKVNIGIAVDVGTGLGTCCIRDVTNKDLAQISADVKGFAEKGKANKLGMEELDMSEVCWTVTALGKNAARFACSVLPPGSAGILSIGRAFPAGQETFLSAAMCHQTLTG